MLSKVLLILGILGFFLGLLLAGVSLALPELTDGRTSYEEAMLGFVPGVVVIIFSLLLALIGLALVIKGRKSQ